MKLEISEEKYTFLPSQIIEHKEGIIIRRGVTQLTINGEMIFDIIKIIVNLSSDDGITKEEVFDYFGENEKENIEALLSLLERNRIFIKIADAELDHAETDDEDFSRSDVFAWSIGLPKQKIDAAKSTRIIILGVNSISRQMIQSLKLSGFNNFEVVDVPVLRNTRFFESDGTLKDHQLLSEFKKAKEYIAWVDQLEFEDQLDCMVCTSDFGGMQLMKEFNEFAIGNDINFMPVVLQDLKGYVGPLIIPHQTACMECMLHRQNAHLDFYAISRSIELSNFEGQEVIGFHPSMASMLADIAVFELYKFFNKLNQSMNVSTLIEVNMLNTEIKNKKIHKIPRCKVCGPTEKGSPYTVFESTYMLTHEE